MIDHGINRRKCRLCKKEISGRSDKVYCSVKCKSDYSYKLRNVTNIATKNIDDILHRNRSILLEILGKNKSQIKITKLLLDRKKFNFTYITHFHINSLNKMVCYVYDFSWMVFSDYEVLIKRLK